MNDHAVALSAHPRRISFASGADAARHRHIEAQLARHRALIEALEREQEAILRRATWSLTAIMERDG